MLNIPMLKLEKNNVYLNTQLEQQENNKQLMLDIISNIDLILNKNTKDIENYQNIREDAYNFLNTISSNITSLEQLNIEITGISKELENLQSEENKNTRTKEFYIVSFSNIKNNIAQYTEKFQNLQKKLELDNNNFNEFININNFKYNFESVENDEGIDSNTYKFTGFSIETTNEEVLDNSPIETIEEAVTDNISVPSEIENKVETQESSLEEVCENISDEIVENEQSISKDIIQNISNEITENLDDNFEISNNEKQTNKIDELTNNFRKMLIDLANEDTTVEDTSNLISNYFKEIHELADAEIERQNTTDNSKTILEANTLEEFQNVTENTVETLENVAEVIEVANSLNNNIEEITEQVSENVSAETQTVTENIIENAENISETFEENIKNVETPESIQNNFETSIENFENKMQEENIENEYTEEFFEKPYEINESEEIEDIIDIPNTDLGYDFGVTNPFNNNFENSKNIVLPIEEKNDEEIQKELLKNKLEKIITAVADNETLIISEKTNNIYLPYKIPELANYIDSYPDAYSSLSDVVAQEFILPFDYFMKHPYKSRFFETYNLMRNRQGNSVISSIASGLKLMHRNDLNPAIIAACKTEDELKTYLYYLDANRLDEFKAFNIIYQVNPL